MDVASGFKSSNLLQAPSASSSSSYSISFSNMNGYDDAEEEFGDFESVPAQAVTGNGGFADFSFGDQFFPASQSSSSSHANKDCHASSASEDDWGDFVQTLKGHTNGNSYSNNNNNSFQDNNPHAFGMFGNSNGAIQSHQGLNGGFADPASQNGVFDPFGVLNSGNRNTDNASVQESSQSTESNSHEKSSTDGVAFPDARKPLPLSLFGEEEEEEADAGDSRNREPDLFEEAKHQRKSQGGKANKAGAGIQLNDLIASLYFQAQSNAAEAHGDGEKPISASEKLSSVELEKMPAESADAAGFVNLGTNDLQSSTIFLEFEDESFDWEFKDAGSEAAPLDKQLDEHFGSNGGGQISLNHNHADVDLLGEEEEEEEDWEFKDALSESNDRVSEDASSKMLELYIKLKEESFSLSLMHLSKLEENLARAKQSSNVEEVNSVTAEIQAAQRKLGITDLEKQKSSESTADEIHGYIQNPELHDLEETYKLSILLSSAANDLKKALDLYAHSFLMTVLISTPAKEQTAYLNVWATMTSICATELENGLKIWNQAIESNVQMSHILSHPKGKCYYAALMEIFNISEVLRVTTELCKAWMLLNPELAKCISLNLEKCATVWVDSGLKDALCNSFSTIDVGTSVSSTEHLRHAFVAKEIYSGDIMHLFSLLLQDTQEDKPLCRISLLPASISNGMKFADWMGNWYILILANLWANCVTFEPPQLPLIKFRD